MQNGPVDPQAEFLGWMKQYSTYQEFFNESNRHFMASDAKAFLWQNGDREGAAKLLQWQRKVRNNLRRYWTMALPVGGEEQEQEQEQPTGPEQPPPPPEQPAPPQAPQPQAPPAPDQAPPPEAQEPQAQTGPLPVANVQGNQPQIQPQPPAQPKAGMWPPAAEPPVQRPEEQPPMIEPKAPPAPPPAAPAPQAPEPVAPAPAEPPVKPEPEEEQGEDPIRWPIELAFRDDATREQIKDMMKHANDKMFDAEFSMMMAGFNAGEPQAKLKSMHDKLDPATQKEFVDTMQRVYGQSHPEWAKELADHHSAMADETEAAEPEAERTPEETLKGLDWGAIDEIGELAQQSKAASEAQEEQEKPQEPEAKSEEKEEKQEVKELETKSIPDQPVELAEFEGKGAGLKAKQPISKGTNITWYGGRLINKEKAEQMRAKGKATHIITNKAGQAVDGRLQPKRGLDMQHYTKNGQVAQFANEADKGERPNAKFAWYTDPDAKNVPPEARQFEGGMGPAIAIQATRDIEPGEEITVSYGNDYERTWEAGEPKPEMPPIPKEKDEDFEPIKRAPKPKKSVYGEYDKEGIEKSVKDLKNLGWFKTDKERRDVALLAAIETRSEAKRTKKLIDNALSLLYEAKLGSDQYNALGSILEAQRGLNPKMHAQAYKEFYERNPQLQKPKE